MLDDNNGGYFNAIVRDAIRELKNKGNSIVFTQEQVDAIRKSMKNIEVNEKDRFYYLKNLDYVKVNYHKTKLYKDKDEEEELEITIPADEFSDVIEKLTGDDSAPVCDLCGKNDDSFSFFPELGHKLLCRKCAREHKKNVKWYTEDLHPVFNSLISFMKTYDLGWTQKDYKVVDDFFSSKGHLSLHIEKFMEDNNDKEVR